MNDPRPPLAGLVLAGGASRRMGTPKATLRLGERSFLEIALTRLADAGCEPLVVVAGRDVDAVREALPPTPPAEVIVNPKPERGQLSSLQVGLIHLTSAAGPSIGTRVQGVLVSLIDQPTIRDETFVAVARRMRDLLAGHGPGDDRLAVCLAITPGVGRGHPVGLFRVVWPDVLGLDAQAPGGLRNLMQRLGEQVIEVPVDDPAIRRDVDTPADLARLVAEAEADERP